MKFCWSTIQVKNMDDSLKFYEDIIQLRLNRRFRAGNDVEIAFLGDGDTKVELICDGTGRDIHIGPDIVWGFEVKSVDEMIAFLKEKDIAVQGGPFSPNPHMKYFYILDPNGLKIQFVETIV
jgi:lactoylglutathione lyase